MKQLKKILIFLGILIIIFSACRKTNFMTGSDATLLFSKDTVHFDTVFNGIGSAVRYFKVYNFNDLPVNVSKVELLGGIQSNFRINVNGSASTDFSDIEINANDSIYVFVDVNIDPQNDDLIEYDQIRFTTNGNEQIVHLLAYGRDIHLLNDSVINTQTWINDKPYVVYNSMALNENEVLTVQEGTHIYFHRNSSMIILGTLVVNGTLNDPVIFEGDRLNGHSSIFFENDSLDNYDDVAGQWNGIWLTKLSKNNYINYAEIKNAVTGIQVDSFQNSQAQLSIHNSKIEHHAYAGIFTQISKIFATNCLIDDCGYYNIALTRGGNYEFYHCTIGNYWSGIRNKPSVYVNNYFLDPYNNLYTYDLYNAHFGNCLIWGNTDNELELQAYTDEGVLFNYLFENCLLKIDEESDINTDDTNHFKNIILNNDPLFTDQYLYDFTLQENSPAIDNGNIEITNLFPELQYDLNHNLRDNNPDIGAFEFQ